VYEGTYTHTYSTYVYLCCGLQHAAIAARRNLIIDWIDASALEAKAERSDPEAFRESWKVVEESDAILVPGGFGDRGVEGKIAAIAYARKSKKPFLGICLGMQCAVIEFARNELGWADANSQEFNMKSTHQVWHIPDAS
jgi:CTP synthase